jgi:hypothetical protein
MTKDFTISKNKSIEFQLEFLNDWTSILGINIDYTTKCDHAGASFELNILKMIYFNVVFYDHRHWNYETETYEVYEEKKND